LQKKSLEVILLWSVRGWEILFQKTKTISGRILVVLPNPTGLGGMGVVSEKGEL
jgi:hypothetical protein